MAARVRFVALDSWRGICALLVVLFHVSPVVSSSLEASTFIRNAYLFVDFFFVLSGFVLCHGYRGKISDRSDLRQFVVRRFARVWPVHAFVLGAFLLAIIFVNYMPHPQDLALTWNENSYSVEAILPSVLLLNAFGLQGSVWNGPAWSIGAEFYVYLLFAIVLMSVWRRFVVACTLLSIVALAVIFWRAPDFMNSTWDYGAVRCVAGFFAGVVAYHCYERWGKCEPIKATIIEIAAVIVVIAFVMCAGVGPDAVGVVSLAAPLVFGAAVVVFAREQGLFAFALHARLFKALGRYSFSIYLIHQPLLIMFCYCAWLAGYQTKAFAGGGGTPMMHSPDLILADLLFAVVLVAAGIYRFIELPARRGLNRLADRHLSLNAATPRVPAFAFARKRSATIRDQA
jgi:peptidoglycan/LPS O-acetylase OafA/YrhL